MPAPGSPPADRASWLAGLIAVGLSLEAAALKDALRARGLSWRSVPAGPARAAWTCATGGGTIAVVLSGRGPEAARRSAAFWSPRTRAIAVGGTAAATGLVSVPAVVVEGDSPLVAAALGQASRQGIEATAGRIATVSATSLSPQACASLAAAGFAAADGESGPWRQAAATLDLPLLACRGVVDRSVSVAETSSLIPPGRSSRSRWRTAALLLRHPRVRTALRHHDQVVTAAARPALACALAALIGPGS